MDFNIERFQKAQQKIEDSKMDSFSTYNCV